MPLRTDGECREEAPCGENEQRHRGSAAELYEQRAELAESLRESEARFRVFSDLATDGLLFHDGGHILHANRRLLELTGHSLADLSEMELVDLVVKEDRELARRRIAERSAEPYEVNCLRKDGSSFPVAVRGGDMNYGGTAARAVWVRDLSERDEVLAALKRSESRYRQLFETCPEGLYVSNLGRRFVAVNPAMVALFGYGSERAMLELDPSTLYVEPVVREDFLERMFAEGSIRDFETVLRTRDGRQLEVRETVNLVRDEADRITGYQGILRDVTEKRQLERQLAEARRMEAVGRLAGGVAHDFNNLLTAISGFSQLALAALESDHPAAQDVLEAQRAAHSASRLTEQLLSFSRRRVLAPQLVDLNGVVTEVQRFLERTLGSDVEITLELADDLAPVLADPGQIEQVLVNLAINSRAAMPDGGRLEIRSRCESVGPLDQRSGVFIPPGDYSLLIVSDDGCGMDAETRDRAFDPFFTTKPEGEGTGLGLATVYGIVKHSGGYVWIDSSPDVGTTFTIYLPQAEDFEAVPSPPEPPTAPNLGTETLLLVEDDEGVREFSRRCLETNGYKVLVAVDAVEARRVVEREGERISMLVTDVVMPNGNGVALARDVQARHPGVTVLLVSGFPDRALELDKEEAKAFPLLAKPFTAKQLTETVRQLLDDG